MPFAPLDGVDLYYEITGDGRKQLDQEEARWRAVTAAVGHILKHA